MIRELKRILVGSPIRTEHAAHERLPKKTALAVFSSDALSSTAYATEEILLVLAVAVAYGQTYAFSRVIPISLGIAALLVLVTISYRQTIHAYPSGGGAYIVAKDNLGIYPGLIAAAALLVDYVLTVSVSIAAGVAAITSAVQGTQLSWLDQHKVPICLGFIALIAVANLRGVRESGSLFAFPTYAFLFSFIFMIAFGFVRYVLVGGGSPAVGHEAYAVGYQVQPLTVFLILGAFSNGCTALTGIEAISNGVPAFKAPEARNASTTLTWMAVLLTVMFLGTSLLAFLYKVHPHESETVISQFARIVFTGPIAWFYYVIQAATAAILVLAANTSFADFPRLASLLARDRFLPRQFANRGDKLVFSNGIVILALFASVLVVLFKGDTSRLIPLYAVGVFLSFTLSQAGMVRHWLRERNKSGGMDQRDQRAAAVAPEAPEPDAAQQALPDALLAAAEADMHHSNAVIDEVTSGANWKKSIVINAIGAVATFMVLTVFIITKFIHGAWLVVMIIPLLVLLFRAIHNHYLQVANQLTTAGIEPLRAIRHEVIVPISGIHRGVLRALEYAKSIAPEHVTAVYVDIDEEATQKLREKWEQWGTDVKLVVLKSPFRELTRPLLKYVDRVDRNNGEDLVTVLLPEFVPARWWHHVLHNQSSLLLKGALLFKRGVIVTSVPYHLE